MTFKEETYNTGMTTTALGPASARPVRWRTSGGGELAVLMAGNSGARDSQRHSDFTGLSRIYLHFNSGRQPMDRPEGSIVRNMRQTCPHRKPRTAVGRSQKDESEGVRQAQTITQRDSSLRAILVILPIERSRFRKA